MAEAKHTPGPWFIPRANFPTGSAGTSVWALGGDVLIAESPSKSLSLEGRRANARLIATAPELLEALQDVLDEWVRDLIDAGEEDVEERAYVKFARAAIAKAKATGSAS